MIFFSFYEVGDFATNSCHIGIGKWLTQILCTKINHLMHTESQHFTLYVNKVLLNSYLQTIHINVSLTVKVQVSTIIIC